MLKLSSTFHCHQVPSFHLHLIWDETKQQERKNKTVSGGNINQCFWLSWLMCQHTLAYFYWSFIPWATSFIIIYLSVYLYLWNPASSQGRPQQCLHFSLFQHSLLAHSIPLLLILSLSVILVHSIISFHWQPPPTALPRSWPQILPSQSHPHSLLYLWAHHYLSSCRIHNVIHCKLGNNSSCRRQPEVL